MTRRRGLSLVEVLVALFIMALGAIAILTMFPLGAMQMGQALKDDRTAQAAGQADAFMRWYWQHYIVEDPSPGSPPNNGFSYEPFVQAFQNPAIGSGLFPQPYPAYPLPQLMFQAGPDPNSTVPWNHEAESGPSYPVAVDPMGDVARPGGASQVWVGTDPTFPSVLGLLSRRNFAPPGSALPPGTQPVVNNAAQAQRLCSLMDGLTYTADGRPADDRGQPSEVTGRQVQRELRYNWLWVLQRPHHTDPTTAWITVVVFDKRAHLYVPPGGGEPIFKTVPGTTAVGQTSARFPARLPVIKGGWVADISTTTFTYQDPQPPDAMGNPQPPITRTIPAVRNCNFYRVASVTDNTPAGGMFDVELQTPLKPDSRTQWTPRFTYPPPPPQPAQYPVPNADQDPVWNYQRTFLVLAGVSEVFERTPLAPVNKP